MKTLEGNEVEWAEARSLSTGGSDIAKIVGRSKFGGAADVADAKLGNPAVFWPAQERMFDIAHRLEAPILQWYEDEYLEPGHELVHHRYELYRHPSCPSRAHASPDALVYGPDETVAYGVQVKTVDPKLAKEFGAPLTDQVPEEYRIQCLWEMTVVRAALATEIDHWVLAVAIGLRDWRVYHIAWDEKCSQWLMAENDSFHDHLGLGDLPDPSPPPPGEAQVAPQVAQEDGDRDNGQVLPASEELDALAAEYAERKRVKDDAEAILEATAERIKACLGKAAGAKGADYSITYKWANGSDKIDYEAAYDELAAALPMARRREIERRHRKTTKGSRRFRLSWSK